MSAPTRTYPVSQIAGVLHHVNATGATIDGHLFDLLREPPTNRETWEFELDALEGMLWSLSAYCDDARQRIEALRSSG